MPAEITIPRLGWSMEEGIFGDWLKKDGDFVAAGEAIFELETEKALQEVEALDAGTLHILKTSPASGDTVAVGTVIGYLLADGEAVPDRGHSAAPGALPDSSQRRRAEQPQQAASDVAPLPRHDDVRNRPRISPRAARTAARLNLDPTTLAGSGRNGRIRERDVLAADAQAAPVPVLRAACEAAGVLHPVSTLRSTIAERLRASTQQTVPVTLTTKVDATSLVALRHRLRLLQRDPLPAYNDILLHLVAGSLAHCPYLNAAWQKEGIRLYDEVNIALAVDTDAGLLAPVVRHADRLTLQELSRTTKHLIEQARNGRLNRSELTGGTFTISNLGPFGVEFFTPVINPPQTAVLGIGRIAAEPVVRDGTVVAGTLLALSLTFDHQVIDGVPAARWLQLLSDRIARADTLLIDA